MRRVLVPFVPAVGERVCAGPDESRHLLRVLRAHPGERFRLADGAGGAAIGVLAEVDARGAAVLLVEELVATVVVPERVVLLGVPKPALLEEALTLGTEGGATRFSLVRARYSPPGDLRAERLERVLKASVTQCGRPDLPAVDGPRPLREALQDAVLASVSARWLATPGATRRGAAEDLEEGAAVAIGPEGGWAPEEVELLTAAGFRPLGLGPFVLRTPSAVGAALARLWG